MEQKSKKNDLERLGIKQLNIELPSNSHRSKIEEPSPKKKVEKVVSGKVRTQKKSLGKRFSEIFFSKDAEGVGSYLGKDVLLPSIKSTLYDLVTYGFEMLLYGEIKSKSSRSSSGNKSYVSYQGYYDKKTDRGRGPSESNRSAPNINDLLFDTRGDAQEVIDGLAALLQEYPSASLADLYDLCNLTSTNFMDNKYGWTDIRSASIRRVRDGYLLELPRPVCID